MSEFLTYEVRISEYLEHNKLDTNKCDSRSLSRMVRRLIQLVSGVSDPRMQGKVTYHLDMLVSCMFLADIAGAECSEDVVAFWTDHRKLYRRTFGIDKIPSHDTFRRVLAIIKSTDLNTVMNKSLKKAFKTIKNILVSNTVENTLVSNTVENTQVSNTIENTQEPQTTEMKQLIPLDGKQERGTGRKEGTSEEVKDLQTMNVYNQAEMTCIYTEPIETKTNEIPAGQEILKKMNLKDAVVTFDALHTQKETVRIITENGGDYVGGLKGNQAGLQDYCDHLFTDKTVKEIAAKGDEYHIESSEIAHNQLEERSYYLHKATKTELNGVFSGWKGLKSVVCYVKQTTNNVTGKKSSEVRTYISSLTDIHDIAYCIRSHWSIENNLHWCLDTIFHEDRMQITDRQAATNQSIMNKAALTLCKLAEDFSGDSHRSVTRRRKRFGWAFEENLARVLALMDEKDFDRVFQTTPIAN